MDNATTAPLSDAERSARNIATVVYGLQILGVFLGGVPALIGLIINYVKRSDVQGTLAQSHFRWQIRTFWFGLLWAVIGVVLLAVAIGMAVLVADGIWMIYRVVKGWLYLNDRKAMYA
ncbi:Putative membrane protein OS=Castellaniella defragrans OX=75697 GN=HNR28_001734 PE=4 SV=1 [Castellaniella defragrans]